jgi:hypothetical protein
MKITDYTLPNGTASKIIEAEDGYTFYKDGADNGNRLILGLIFRDAEGNPLVEPILEQPSDYTEVAIEEDDTTIVEQIRELLDE